MIKQSAIVQNAYDAPHLGETKPKILIGGKSSKFVPNLNISFQCETTSEQYFININRKSLKVGSQVQKVVGGKLKLKVGNNTDIWHVDDNGRLKWDIQFDSKPSGNVFEWELKCSKELEFCYQPALTEAEIAKGTVRPPEVVGSYAVYCDKKGHLKNENGNTVINYASGKLTHIYRPFCTDALGHTAWADLYINPDDKVLRITIPQDYLDSATYPVTLDPTFGYTTIGATNGSTATGVWWALDALSAAGTLTNLSIACDTAGGNSQTDIKYAFYSDNSGVPDTQLAVDATAWTIPSSSTKTWRTNPVDWSYSLTASTQYWGAAFGASIPPGYAFAYDSGGSKSNRYSSATTPPSPAGTTSQDYTDAHFSVYATYTSGSTSVAVNNSSHAHTAGSPAISQNHVLAVLNAASAHSAGNPAISQNHVLAVLNAASAHSAGNPAISQNHVLAVLNAASAHTATNAILHQIHSVIVQSSAHAQTAGNVSLSQIHALVIQNGVHSHVSENVSLSPGVILEIENALHAHTAGNITTSQVYILSINNGIHSHTSGNLTLHQNHVITISNATMAHSATPSDVITAILLEIANSNHSHTAGSITLSQNHVLAIQNAVHSVLGGTPAISQNHVLIVSNALHAQVASMAGVIPGVYTTPDSRIYIIKAEDRVYIVAREDRTFTVN